MSPHRRWIDPRMAAQPPHPWRKVHIEYHNSRHVRQLADRFDPEEFADRVVQARATGVTVFAKDMYGYSYYPSGCGPVHPGLSFDLLGAQVAALRKRGVSTLVYYMTTWNPELAERHPEWLVVKRPGGSVYPTSGEISAQEQAFAGAWLPEVAGGSAADRPGAVAAVTAEEKAYRPYLWKLCLGCEEFVEGELEHIREIVSSYEIDGIWIDGASQWACYCPECMRALREQHFDPLDIGVQNRRAAALHDSFLERIHDVAKAARPGCLVCPQCEGTFGLAERASFIDYTDIEVLPTDSLHYGYHYCQTMVRFARGFGVPTYGLTTRFKGFWADFGGLKLPEQLLTELAGIVANGARCDIGDQVHPNGRLDPAAYHVIGKVYEHIEALEPFLEQAVPVTEAALLVDGKRLETPCTEPIYGWVKLLVESRVQFDVVESAVPWERYGLVFLPEDLEVDEAMAARLHDFLARGGSVIVAHRAGLLAGTESGWLDRYGLRYAGRSPFAPAYLVPKADLTGDIPAYEYALYEGASQWRAEAPATVLAALGEPLFQRSPEHYTSHLQSPFDHVTLYAALARSGRVGLLAFPLGRSYYNQGYWIYRRAFQRLLRELLPVPLVWSDAPLTTELTVTHQAARPDTGRKGRYLVHVVNYSPIRGTPRHPDFHEDPAPLTNVRVRLSLPGEISAARAVVAGMDLPFAAVTEGGVEVLLSRVLIHEVVSFDVA